MGQNVKDLTEIKTLLAAEYEDWAEFHDYPVDYDDLGDLLDGMISKLCIGVDEIRQLPLEDFTQN
jgi:hypothetical protein